MAQRIKTPITREQFSELDKLAKRANQRIASMKEGQRQAVEYWTGGKTFSRKIPKTEAEYKKRMKEVIDFLNAKTTTRTGWEKVKKDAIQSAGETLRNERKYELTDEELSEIYKEIKYKTKKEMYLMLDLIQAEKYKAESAGRSFDLQKAIAKALASHASAGEAIRRKMKYRERAISSRELRK